MRLQVKGKNLEVSDSIRRYAEEKLGKLNRQLHQGTDLLGKALGELGIILQKGLAGHLDDHVATLLAVGGEVDVAHAPAPSRAVTSKRPPASC